LQTILAQYKALLETVDAWFDRCLSRYDDQVSCKRNCSGCCRGLFDISLLDAALLQQGFAELEQQQQENCRSKARSRVQMLRSRWPQFGPPFILNDLPGNEWQRMPEDDQTPCPLLSDTGSCLVYRYRPMTCRLHGLPNIDLSGESFSDDYCTLNFCDIDPLKIPELRWQFRDLFTQEFDLLGAFSERLSGQRRLELDTFIPTALLIDFKRTDWRRAPFGEKGCTS